MERKFPNVPKVLVDLVEKSDKLIQDNARPPPQEKEWFKSIIEMAQKIADGGIPVGKSSSSGGSSEFSPSSMPSLLKLVKGEEQKDSARVSSFFRLTERDHLHAKKSATVSEKKRNSGFEAARRTNGKKIPLGSVENTSGSNVGSENSHTTPRKPSTRGVKSSAKAENGSVSNTSFFSTSRKTSTRSKKNSKSSENVFNSNASSGYFQSLSRNASSRGKENSAVVENDTGVVIDDKETTLVSQIDSGFDKTFVKLDPGKVVTPVQNSEGSPINLKSIQKSSSRNVSKVTSLEQQIFEKKLKVVSTHSHKPNLVTRSSRFSMGNKKYSGVKETHQPSAVGALSNSKAPVVGKTLQRKEDIAAENLKKLQDARNKKIEEKKRLRDEKMERTKEKRMKLEKAKTLSTKQKSTESVTRSNTAQEKSTERKTRSKEPKSGSTSEAPVKISQANSKKKTTRSENKKLTPPVKAASSSKRTPALKTRTPTPPLKTPQPNETPASSKGRRPTPPMKVTVNPTVISLQNTTVTLKKETEHNGSLKRTLTPTSPPAAKQGISKLKEESLATSEHKMAEPSLPDTAKKPKLETSTPITQTSAKMPDSFKLTLNASSYDMSEIVSSDDDEDAEDARRAQKPIPSWASGLPLRRALIHQYYNPIDTDELFGNTFDVPNLEQIFGVKKNIYSKRTSSAIWQSPHAFC